MFQVSFDLLVKDDEVRIRGNTFFFRKPEATWVRLMSILGNAAAVSQNLFWLYNFTIAVQSDS